MEESRQPGSSEIDSSAASQLNIDEVRSLARQHCEVIFFKWKLLNDIIERHESTIQQQWTRFTTAKQRKILLEVRPSMPHYHRPDITSFVKNQDPDFRTLMGPAFVCPNLNLADLSSRAPLLLLLNSRGRNKPAAFARSDLTHFHFSYLTRKHVKAALNQYVMLLEGREDPDSYAELVHRDKFQDPWETNRRQRIFLPHEGMAILGVQFYIYPFLVSCCEAILLSVNIAPEIRLDIRFPIQPEPPSLSQNRIGSASLSTMISEARYQLPAKLDLKRLETLIRAQLRAVEDHLWAMRNDPGYYVDTIKEWAEHREESILDANGEKAYGRDPFLNPSFMEDVIRCACMAAIEAVSVWGFLYDHIVSLQLIPMNPDGLSQDEYSSFGFAQAMMNFRLGVVEISEISLGFLQVGIRCSPRMRKYFVRQPVTSDGSTWQIAKSGKEWDHEDVAVIDWWITMMSQSAICESVRWETILEELERESRKSATIQSHISRFVACQISEATILHQCIVQIDLHLPWAHKFGDQMSDRFKETTKSWKLGDESSFGKRITMLGTPSGSRFDCPKEPLKSRESVKAMIKAEASLEVFWLAVDHWLRKSDRISDRLSKLLTTFKKRRHPTPEWVDPTKTSAEDGTSGLSSNKSRKSRPTTKQKSPTGLQGRPTIAKDENAEVETLPPIESSGQAKELVSTTEHLPIDEAQDRASTDPAASQLASDSGDPKAKTKEVIVAADSPPATVVKRDEPASLDEEKPALARESDVSPQARDKPDSSARKKPSSLSLPNRGKSVNRFCRGLRELPFVYDSPALYDIRCELVGTKPRRHSAIALENKAPKIRRRSLPFQTIPPQSDTERLPKYLDSLLEKYFNACQIWLECVDRPHGPVDFNARQIWLEFVDGPLGPSELAAHLDLYGKWNEIDDALRHEYGLAHDRSDTEALRLIEHLLADLEIDLMTILESYPLWGPKCSCVSDCPEICSTAKDRDESVCDSPGMFHSASKPKRGECEANLGSIHPFARIHNTANNTKSKKSGKKKLKKLQPTAELEYQAETQDVTNQDDNADSNQEEVQKVANLGKAGSTNNDTVEFESNSTSNQDTKGQKHNEGDKANSKKPKKNKRSKEPLQPTSDDEYLDKIWKEARATQAGNTNNDKAYSDHGSEETLVDAKTSSTSPESHGMPSQVSTSENPPVASRTVQAGRVKLDRFYQSINQSADLARDQKDVIVTSIREMADEIGAFNPDGMPTFDQVVKLLDQGELLIENVKNEFPDEDDKPIFELEPRFLKVFSSMFWVQSHTSSPAAFTWKDFVAALSAIGFHAEELYGSVWLFSQADGNCILFQAPHSDVLKNGKIPYPTARNFGRRLRVHFRLELDQFRLKKADVSETRKKEKDDASRAGRDEKDDDSKAERDDTSKAATKKKNKKK